MNHIYNWANKHHISYEALQELLAVMGANDTARVATSGISETAVQTNERLKATKIGARLYRNNVGVLMNDRGVPVRYGLCNESAKMNKKIKSSDLIGIKPVLITQQMVGSIIGQFMARECKPGTWVFTGTEHEVAQLKFIEIINSLGGDAKFTNGND